MTFALIDAEKTHHAVSVLARVLGVSREGYHAWRRRGGRSTRAADDQTLTTKITAVAIRLGQPGEAALSQACLAFAAGFQDRARATEQIARADALLAGVSLRWAEIHTRAAELVRDAGIAADLPDRADALAETAREAGLTSSVAYVRFAACLHAVVLDDPALLAETRAQLRTCIRGEEFAYLAELTYLAAGHEPPSELPLAQWIDESEQVRVRWVAIVEDRRREAAVRREE